MNIRHEEIKSVIFDVLFKFCFMQTQDKKLKVYVAGHRGLVGSAILRKLKSLGFENIVTRTHSELDLTNTNKVDEFFQTEKPDIVYLAAARVGGINAHLKKPVEFLVDNVLIEVNVIQASFKYGVKKLLFLASSCIYPKMAKQPIREEELMTGELEKSNEGYALAKIIGLKLCDSYNKQYNTNYISVMPCNLYGPGDSFDLEHCHVFPALIRKFYEAKKNGDKSVTVWGTGTATREFLHADDLADACIYLMDHYNESLFLNVGTGEEISIKDFAYMIKEIIGYEGEIVFDTTKPDGTPRKLMDVSRIQSLGWKHKIDLKQGIKDTYDWFVNSQQAKQNH